MTCRLCGSSETKQLVQHDGRTNKDIHWLECRCGFVSQTPYSTDEEQGKMYGTFDILDPEFRPWHTWETLLESVQYNAQIMDADRDRYPLRRHLEIAAFSGFLMEQMRRRGWNVRGQELTQHGCDEAAKHGLTVECASVYEWEPHAEFDVISCREFLEHVWDFRGLLARCFRWQAQGGALWIQTPVTDSGVRFDRKIAFQADHVSLFSLANIDRELRLVGYTPVLLENRDGCGIVKAIK